MRFEELKPFKKFAKSKKVTIEMIDDLKQELTDSPKKGSTIVGTGGVRKIRMALQSSGKSGGARIIYYYIGAKGAIYLITGYFKNEKENLNAEEKREMKKLTAVLDKL